MCGIVGWVDWARDLTRERPALARMAETLTHRGPDAHGEWLSSHAALAHRRLIVIDPATGGQPMVYRVGDHTYTVTYNGEIYNFRELREELEGRGHTFVTRSDTEVLLHAYVAWGDACVERLNGIFAFGLWDAHAQRLLLARDRLGVKPLYYAQRGSAVLFASELKALLAHPLIEPVVDADGLAQALTFVRTPGSGVYRDVQELGPGCLVVAEAGGLRVRRYWSLVSAPHPDDLPTTVERVRALLDDTVRRQLIADVPVATLLSGGLDSSGVTALAAAARRRSGRPLRTYAIDFVESAQHFRSTPLHPSLDAPWTARMVEHLGTTHRTVTVGPDALVEHLLVALRAHDVPTAGQMTSSLYLLCKAIKEEATVALSGESADELFGGYPWFHREAALAAPAFPWLPAILGPADTAHNWLAPDLVRRVRPAEHIAARFREAVMEVPRLEGEDMLAAQRRQMFYLNLTRFLPFLLERKDRMSMATGLEVRVPFCDHRLMEYVWNVPWDMKTVDGVEKGLLRRAFADVLPADVCQRRKSAYPSAHSPAYERATRALARAILEDARAPIQPLINAPVVRAIVDDATSTPQGVQLVSFFERFIQLNAWLDEYHVRLAL